MLVYPEPAGEHARPCSTLATVTSGRRTVRLVLAALPFGFKVKSPHGLRVAVRELGLRLTASVE